MKDQPLFEDVSWHDSCADLVAQTLVCGLERKRPRLPLTPT